MKLPKFDRSKMTKRKVAQFFIYWFWVLAGNFIAASASAWFIIPSNLVMGGVTGVGIFIGHFWDNSFAVSAVVYIANAILFIIGVIFLGKRFAVATAAGTVLYPTFLQLSSFLIERFNGGQSLAGDNVLLSVICGGLMFGFGLGLVVRVGASTGGTDIPPLILHKYFGFPVSVGLWVLDIIIVTMQLTVCTMENFLYGVLITILTSVVIDKVAPIGMRRTQVKIVSKKYKEIRDMILNKISRGVTVLYGQTGYLKENCYMILTIISHRELVKLKTEVQAIDPMAFMTISVVSEVRGRGFTAENITLPKPSDLPEMRVVTEKELGTPDKQE